jgi:hypothetical protein
MSIVRLVGLATSLVALLPAFRSHAADDEAPQANHDLRLFCLEFRERMFECRQEFADAFIHWWHPPAAQRDRLRAKALDVVTKGGSGPREPRMRACPRDSGLWSEQWLRVMREDLSACAARTDCHARTTCAMPIMFPKPWAPAQASR